MCVRLVFAPLYFHTMSMFVKRKNCGDQCQAGSMNEHSSWTLYSCHSLCLCNACVFFCLCKNPKRSGGGRAAAGGQKVIGGESNGVNSL